MPDRKPICEEERDWVERHRPVFSPYHDAADEEDSFLDGDRYELNDDWYNRDRRLVQIRGKETEDAIQHDAAVWYLKPRNLQARPIDQKGDPVSAEFMASLVSYEITRVDKGFEEELYKAVMASMEHRFGIVWFDWHPDCGQWGEIFPGEEDFRNFMWDARYSPHHPLNDRLFREKRVDVDWARETYDAPWLEPDRMFRSRATGRSGRPLLRGGQYGVASPQDYDDDNVSLWQFWHKKDKSKKYRDKQDGKDQILPPEQRYMSCSSGCGWRSPRQGDVDFELPEAEMQACPTCGGDTERIDSLGEQETIYAYAKGKRLVIMAPFGQSPDDKPLVDENWPIPRCRSYPGIFIPFKIRSGRLMGGSKVSWAWDQQQAADQLKTMMVQQVFSSQPIYIIPNNGLTDRDKKRYEMRDDQERVAFRDDSNQFMRPNPIERVDGGQVDRSAPVVLQIIENTLAIGKADLGLTEESSKDIAASSIAQQVKQEELPNADFFKRTARYIAQGLNVYSDMITGTYPPARLARLDLEGTDVVMQVWGQDLPGMDLEIEVSPEFTGLEKSRAESLKVLEEQFFKYVSMGLPAEIASEMVGHFAEELRFPPSTVRKFQKTIMKIAQHQAEAAEQARVEAEGQNQTMEDEAAADMDAGIDVPGLELPMEQGMNGGGMEPQLSE